MSRRKKNPRKRPARSRAWLKCEAARQAARARAFWAMRRERREPAEPPEPAWFGIARIWGLALLVGYLAWTVVRWTME